MKTLAVGEVHLWQHRAKDARWLAERIRTNALTILQGQEGAGKTTLLLHGVLPQLQRRSSDPVGAVPLQARRSRPEAAITLEPPRTPGVVIPFPDRRRAPRTGTSSRDSEVVIYLDDWHGAPLATLARAMQAGMHMAPSEGPVSATLLGERLSTWHREQSVRFLVVMDDFDACLKASIDHPEAGEFIDLWVQLLLDPLSPVHFIVALTEPAEPLWQLIKRYLVAPGELRDHRLQLTRVSLAPSPAKPAQPASMFGTDAAMEAADDDDDEGPDSDYPTDFDEEDNALDADMRTATIDLRRASADIGQDSRWAPVHDATSPRRQARHNPLTWHGAVMVLSVLAVMSVSFFATRVGMSIVRDEEPASVQNTSKGVPAAADASTPPLSIPGFELVADASDRSDAMIVTDLARLLTPKGSVAPTIRFPTGWAANLRLLAEKPGLSIVSYDVLQAARLMPDAPQLQVVTPLFSEEIYFVVRKDSPLEYVHQIKGARINIGPLAGNRALITNDVYKRMYGTDLPTASVDSATREAALDRMLAPPSAMSTSTVPDVLVLSGAQPDPWLAGLDEARKSGLRLLVLDPANAATGKAIAAFLPTRVTPAKGSGLEPPEGARTLAVMTFLVTSSDQVPGASEQVTAAVNAICRNLPGLKQSGHPKWREVQPGMQLETGWSNSPRAAEAFRNCQSPKP